MKQTSIEESRRRLKEKLYAAKASGLLTESDEALILEYVLSIIRRRKQ